MSTQETIGTIIDDTARRDAIHIAVEPVIAHENLYAGERISLHPKDKTRAIRNDGPDTIGVVDPFLTDRVRPGQKFWMFLLPNTITSLRHEWTHPAFGEPKAPVSSKELSEAWLRKWVEDNDVPGYEEVLARAVAGPEWGDDYLLVRGMDAHALIPPEFWRHVEVVTGQTFDEKHKAKSFSCAC